jgi:chromosome segregation ATPase
MTVLYGQAIHDLKHRVRSVHDEIQELQAALSGAQSQLSNKQTEVDTLLRQVDTVQSHLHVKHTEVDRLTQQVSAGQKELDTLRRHMKSTRQEKRGVGQADDEQVTADTSRVINMTSRRARSSTSQQEDAVLEAQIRELLKKSPGLSGRAIAARVQCSPTTANKWKSIFEKEVGFVTEQSGQ